MCVASVCFVMCVFCFCGCCGGVGGGGDGGWGYLFLTAAYTVACFHFTCAEIHAGGRVSAECCLHQSGVFRRGQGMEWVWNQETA